MGCHRCGQTTEASVRHAQLSANGRTFFYLSEGTVKALDVACKGSPAFSFMSCVSSHSNCLKMVFAYFHKYPVPYENDSNSQNANNISGCTSYTLMLAVCDILNTLSQWLLQFVIFFFT